MKLRLPMAVAISAGALTLLAYYLPLSPLSDMRLLFVEWASTLAAVALLVGVANLGLVHLQKISALRGSWYYSIVLLLALVLVFGLGLLALTGIAPYDEFARTGVHFSFVYIQTPLEVSLASLLVVIMVVAGARLIAARRNWQAVLFVATAFVLVLGFAPVNLPFLDALPALRDWVMQVPAAGGARGILLGIALGAIATGLRVIVGADHPYGE